MHHRTGPQRSPGAALPPELRGGISDRGRVFGGPRLGFGKDGVISLGALASGEVGRSQCALIFSVFGVVEPCCLCVYVTCIQFSSWLRREI